MKNIISYKIGTKFSGKEIKEWINYHINNKTSHTKQAQCMKKFLNLKDDEVYILCKENYSSCSSYGAYYFIKWRYEYSKR